MEERIFLNTMNYEDLEKVFTESKGIQRRVRKWMAQTVKEQYIEVILEDADPSFTVYQIDSDPDKLHYFRFLWASSIEEAHKAIDYCKSIQAARSVFPVKVYETFDEIRELVDEYFSGKLSAEDEVGYKFHLTNYFLTIGNYIEKWCKEQYAVVDSKETALKFFVESVDGGWFDDAYIANSRYNQVYETIVRLVDESPEDEEFLPFQ